jgi:AmpD protein
MEPRWSKYRWSRDWMTDHRQVAPDRKDDLSPGEWLRLFEAIRSRFE